MNQNQINSFNVVQLLFSFGTFFLSCWKFQKPYFDQVKVFILSPQLQKEKIINIFLSIHSLFFKATMTFLQPLY